MTKEEVFVFDKFTPPALDKPFVFGVTGLNHGHIYGMVGGLLAAGATLKAIWEEDKALLEAFLKKYPNTKVCETLDELLADDEISLIASASVPVDRAPIAIKTMRAGKDFFVDKAPLITLQQLEDVKACCAETGKKLFVYYSEFVAVEAAVYAKQLIDRGVIGEVCHIDIFAPHSLAKPTRPDWFWRREDTGGILIDIGSHQFHQFLEYSGCNEATVTAARVGNYFNSDVGDGFDDFGDAMLTAANGVTGYVRIDWMSPKGIGTWGDGRVTIIGSKGYIELRKNCNLAYPHTTNNVFVGIDDGAYYECVSGKVGLSFYSNIINDCLNRTDTAMDPELAFNAIELAIKAELAGLEQNRILK